MQVSAARNLTCWLGSTRSVLPRRASGCSRSQQLSVCGQRGLPAAATLGALMACISATSLSVSPSQYGVLLIEYSRKNEANRPSFSQRDPAKKSRRGKPCLQHRTDQIFHSTELERPIATWMIAGENTHRRVRARHRSEEWFRVAERLHRATSSEPHLSNH